jgi:hypothetical protein
MILYRNKIFKMCQFWNWISFSFADKSDLHTLEWRQKSFLVVYISIFHTIMNYMTMNFKLT